MTNESLYNALLTFIKDGGDSYIRELLSDGGDVGLIRYIDQLTPTGLAKEALHELSRGEILDILKSSKLEEDFKKYLNRAARKFKYD